jgi:hypothetical protein
VGKIIARDILGITNVGKIEPLFDDNPLWTVETVELKRGEELWIEAHYPSGQIIKGRVKYTRMIYRGTNSGSWEKVGIPEFSAVGESNPLIPGDVIRYRLFRG